MMDCYASFLKNIFYKEKKPVYMVYALVLNGQFWMSVFHCKITKSYN